MFLEDQVVREQQQVLSFEMAYHAFASYVKVGHLKISPLQG
jgi:hypothetical protein